MTARDAATTLAQLIAAGLLAATVSSAAAQTAQRDGIADLLAAKEGAARLAQAQSKDAAGGTTSAPQAQPPEAQKDPREGDPAYEQAQRLTKAIDAVLQDTARNRGEAKKLPAENDFLMKPLWTETREDRERKIRELLDSALGVITDVPVVDIQRKIETLRRNMRDLDDHIVKLREKQLTAPKDAMLPGLLTDTVDSLGNDVEEAKKKIEANRSAIATAKSEVHAALASSGIQLAPDQVDLLLDSVLSGDLVRLVAVFNSAKLIDGQLAKLMAQSGESINAARKYFAMHAALFAMLVHAQGSAIEKIDTNYMPKLDAILKDITSAQSKTAKLLQGENRPDQKRALEANRDAQKVAADAAKGYRRYLQQQREQIAKARTRAVHDLRIADNTYETVEASFQLKNLMRDSAASFEAIQKLEAPTFDQIFKNEELRQEFENLTRRLDAPSS